MGFIAAGQWWKQKPDFSELRSELEVRKQKREADNLKGSIIWVNTVFNV